MHSRQVAGILDRVALRGIDVQVRVHNPGGHSRGVASAELDGALVDPAKIPLVDDGAVHVVVVTMGPRDAASGSTS